MRQHKRVVVKIGTKVITSKDRSLDKERIRAIVNQIAALRRTGVEVILVTSGAIGAGMNLMGMKKRPTELSVLQAAAAIGQNYLMHLYGEYFKPFKLHIGQILLTQEDFNDRKRYLNIKHTIEAVLKHDAVPIINENDTVATEEIRCGDNDRLSSLVADLCRAETLIILTDVDGLLDKDGRVIDYVYEITPQIVRLGGHGVCDLGTGGMATKIDAAKTVTGAGIECVIANGKEENVLSRLIMEKERIGTAFKRKAARYIAKKRWIAFSSRPKGVLTVDDGAKTALRKGDRSLLASGILAVEGNFDSGGAVSITDRSGCEFARGLVSYSSKDLAKIKGLKSDQFKNVLGCKGPDEVVHKDNLVILQ